MLGGFLILGAVTLGVEEIAQLTTAELAAHKAQEAASVQIPYLVLAGALFVLAAIFSALQLPSIEQIESEDDLENGKNSASQGKSA